MEIKIRDVDPMIVKKLDEMAKKQSISREAFLRKKLEQMSALAITEEINDKYAEIVSLTVSVIKENTKELTKLSSLLEEFKG